MTDEVEHWVPMRHFGKYEISNLGRIAHAGTDELLTFSYTQQGDVKVNLYQDMGRRNLKQRTRSVKKLVAEHFVARPEQVGPHPFDTPIQLDGDVDNCAASNLMWRPRWFAINWRLELDRFVRNPEDWAFYNLGPVVEVEPSGHIVAAYHTVAEVSFKHGYLLSDIWKSINTGVSVFPDMKKYELHQGV